MVVAPIFLIAVLGTSTNAWAHGGRLNSEGCHNDKIIGVVHCHRSKIKSKAKAKMKLLKVGDMVETPPNEMHALKIGKNGNEFIVFTVGKRGGKDYEGDTFRFTPTLIQ